MWILLPCLLTQCLQVFRNSFHAQSPGIEGASFLRAATLKQTFSVLGSVQFQFYYTNDISACSDSADLHAFWCVFRSICIQISKHDLFLPMRCECVKSGAWNWCRDLSVFTSEHNCGRLWLRGRTSRDPGISPLSEERNIHSPADCCGSFQGMMALDPYERQKSP